MKFKFLIYIIINKFLQIKSERKLYNGQLFKRDLKYRFLVQEESTYLAARSDEAMKRRRLWGEKNVLDWWRKYLEEK